jgi:hypothetical protein
MLISRSYTFLLSNFIIVLRAICRGLPALDTVFYARGATPYRGALWRKFKSVTLGD